MPATGPPAVVPTGTATFGLSNTTTITFSNNASVGTLQFNAGAPAYSFEPSGALEITGTGIVNNSSNRPTFIDTNSETNFLNTSTAGNATINNSGGVTGFFGTSRAGNATITNSSGGITSFMIASTADTSTITTNSGGPTFFFDTSTGGDARLITNAGGILDVSGLSSSGMTAGSIEGAGTYQLGSKALTVGLNNLRRGVQHVWQRWL